jgi:hypothetical protein
MYIGLRLANRRDHQIFKPEFTGQNDKVYQCRRRRNRGSSRTLEGALKEIKVKLMMIAIGK